MLQPSQTPRANFISAHGLPLLLLLGLGFWGIGALFQPGLYTAHDIWHNVARFYWYTQALFQGEILPGWIAPLAGGYGYPLFLFSYPLPWLAGFPLVALGFPLEVALKMLYGGSFILSGLIMYGFSARLFHSRLAALVSGELYMIAPYHFLTTFVSAATGIAFAYTLVPLLFWGIWEIGQEKYRRGMILLSLGLMGVITSHLILAVMLSLFAALWSLFVFLQATHKQHVLKNMLVGVLLGLGLSAFYLVPFGTYSKLIRANDPGAGFAKLYETNFATLEQLLYSPWGFGPIISNAKDGEISLQVGIAQWLAFFGVVMLFGVTLTKLGWRRQFSFARATILKQRLLWRKRNAIGIMLMLLYALSVFAIWELSKPVWDYAAHYVPLDYPFRLLVVAVLFGSLLAGWMVRQRRLSLTRMVLAGLFITIALYTNRNHRRVNLYTQIPISDYVQAEKTTNTMDEYLPLAAERSLTNKPYVPVEPEVVLADFDQTPTTTHLTVEATQAATLTLGQWVFPTQLVRLNGAEIAQQTSEDGRIEIALPEGKHELAIVQRTTAPFVVGYGISMISSGIVVAICIIELRKKKS